MSTLSSTHALQKQYQYISEKLHDTASRGQDGYSGDRASVPDPHIALPCDWRGNISPLLVSLSVKMEMGIHISLVIQFRTLMKKLSSLSYAYKKVVLIITSTLPPGENSKAKKSFIILFQEKYFQVIIFTWHDFSLKKVIGFFFRLELLTVCIAN